MIRRPPRSTRKESSAASDVYKRQADDGETQIRLVPAGDIDEFKVDIEGSNMAFKGVFRILNQAQAEEQMEDYGTEESHTVEMAHSEAEKAEYFIEATELKEVTP